MDIMTGRYEVSYSRDISSMLNCFSSCRHIFRIILFMIVILRLDDSSLAYDSAEMLST